jgi:hypothetical protein
MLVDDIDHPFELVGQKWVERMGVLGEFSGAGPRLSVQAGQLLAAELLSVLL